MPSAIGDERATLVAFLNEQRRAIARALDGLTEEQARWRPCEGANSLIEMVNHLSWVERWWFECTFSGAPDPWPPDDPDADFKVPTEQTISETLASYADACRRSNEIVKRSSLGSSVETESGETSLRWIVVHMIEETARHAGHADITRQLIDGRTAT